MKKYLATLMAAILLVGCSSSTETANQSEVPPGMKVIGADAPKGALYEGSITSKQLMGDVIYPALSFASGKGCDKAVDMVPFLSKEPEGSRAQHTWQEIWQFKCNNGNKYPVNITFTHIEGKGTHYIMQ